MGSNACHAERLGLAAELHDGVAGRLSALTLHVTTARHHRDRDADLDLVAEELNAALAELRRMLGLLQKRRPPEPHHGLRDLGPLVQRARDQGADIAVSVAGPLASLEPRVDRTAYRILQESLTNVVCHARPPTARVTVTVSDQALQLSVDDDGCVRTVESASPAVDARPGFGLAIMTERAEQVGGRLRAGRRPDGGWSMVARLPVRPEAAVSSPVLTPEPSGASAVPAVVTTT